MLIEIDNKLALYHSQWLWGEYAIRRLGSFIYALQEKSKKDEYFDAPRQVNDCMQWAFLKNLLDQNNIHKYNDNLWLQVKDLKEKESIEGLIADFDNNNGVLYLRIKKDKIIGYAFYNPTNNESDESRQGRLIDYKEYLKDYDSLDFDNEQKQELKMSKQIFEKLNLLTEFTDIKEFID